ncbi:hypothetical protein [Streptosporangium sp. KLBMP 9127]|nr:hypothetical protein [Streptosporangium sp. KLBMP 9127]
MTRLARQTLIVIYEARFPNTPTWTPGPLIFQHRHVRSTTQARSDYYSAKAARILYGTADQPRRWHNPATHTTGDITITGVELLRATDQPDAPGLIAIHLRPRPGTLIELLRSLAGRRDAPPPGFDPQDLLDGQAKVESGGRPFTVSFITPAGQGLPRLYRHPRYWRWPAPSQWLWAMASRTTHTDYPPDPKNLEPADADVIRLSIDWHAVVLRDAMAVTGLRPDQGAGDTFFGYADLYLRSIYLDAILLGILQNQALTQLEARMTTALDSSMATTMTHLEREVSTFRHQLWSQHLTPRRAPNQLLAAYQREHALRERFEQILTEISDYNRLTRDDETQRVNSAVVLFTLVTVPAGIALALLQVLETQDPRLITTIIATCLILTALLLRTRSARLALHALRRRFTP